MGLRSARSLQQRIVASVLLGLGVVLVGLGYLATLAFEHNRDAVLAERLAVAQEKRQALDHEVADALDLLGRLGRDLAPRLRTGSSDDVSKILSHVFTETATVFSALGIAGRDGRVTAMAGRASWREVVYLPSGSSPGVFEIPANPPALGLAAPALITRESDLWIVGEFRAQRLLRHLRFDHLGGGTYGAEVLTGNGTTVATSPGQRVSAAHAQLVVEFGRQGRAGIVLHDPPGGRPHYIVYAPLTAPAGWGLVLEQSQDAVVAIPQRLRRWMLAIGLSVLLAGTVVAWWDVRRVTRPLKTLTAAAGRIGRGDLSTPVRIDGQDEIGVLGRTIEDMRLRLTRSRDEIAENAKTVATLRERERLARELHDGLAQALATVYASAGTGKLRLAKGNREGVDESLDEVLSVSRRAYEEVRQSIFGLRTMVSRGLGLIPAITEYLHEFSERSGIPVQLIVEDEDATRLSPEVETQVIRIIQEALTNVWRHAHAHRALISFSRDNGIVEVAVEDDGVGFPPGAPGSDGERHFGLQTMRERAESVGGSLSVASQPDAGTRVAVRLPAITSEGR